MKLAKLIRSAAIAGALSIGGTTTMAFADTAYLEITLKVANADRPAAAAVYEKYKQPFLTTVKGAKSKQLLIRNEDVQVLHGFETTSDAEAYLASDLFKNDVVKELSPLLKEAPDVRIYTSN